MIILFNLLVPNIVLVAACPFFVVALAKITSFGAKFWTLQNKNAALSQHATITSIQGCRDSYKKFCIVGQQIFLFPSQQHAKSTNMSLQDLDIESAEQGLISTVCWVPKGSFSLAPKLTSQEEAKTAYEDMKKAEQAQAAQQNAQDDQDTVDDEDEVMKEFNMGKYDEEDDDFEVQMAKSLIDNPTLERVFAENQQDPAILQARDSDDEDEEDYSLAPTDRLLLAVNNEDFVSQMLVYVVEADNNLFVHHDLMLSNYGICIEWIGMKRNHFYTLL